MTATGESSSVYSQSVSGADGTTPIFRACATNDINKLKELLAQGADINEENDQGYTLLCVALKRSIHTVEFLIDAGADINRGCSADGSTPLMIAAEKGQEHKVEILIEKGADLMKTDEKGYTALHRVAASGNPTGPTCATRIINACPDIVSVVDNEGQTALHTAAKQGSLPLVQMLVIHDKTLMKKTDKQGRLPLHMATIEGRVNCVQCLMVGDSKKLISSGDSDGYSVADYALKENKTKVIDVLLAKGLDINSKDKDGRTLLMQAASYGLVAMFDHLVKKKANVSLTDNQGNTVLHQVARDGQIQFCKKCVDLKIDVNAVNSEELTPLSLAAKHGHVECAAYLLDNGARNIPDKNKRLAAHHAIENDKLDVLEQLVIKSNKILKYRDNSVIHFAAASGKPEALQIIINNGASPDFRDANNLTPLHTSASEGHVTCCQVLVENHADVNASDGTKRKHLTPLDYAEKGNQKEVIEYLESVGGVRAKQAHDSSVEKFRQNKAAKTIQRGWKVHQGRKKVKHANALKELEKQKELEMERQERERQRELERQKELERRRMEEKKKKERPKTPPKELPPLIEKTPKKRSNRPAWNSSVVIHDDAKMMSMGTLEALLKMGKMTLKPDQSQVQHASRYLSQSDSKLNLNSGSPEFRHSSIKLVLPTVKRYQSYLNHFRGNILSGSLTRTPGREDTLQHYELRKQRLNTSSWGTTSSHRETPLINTRVQYRREF